MSPAPQKPRTGATLAIVSLALFMVVLDNLIVTVALPSIRADLGATLQSLEWTINAYTLAFAVMLIPGAALGDRFGRRRLFLAGLALFTASSRRRGAGARRTGALVAARALQGVGGAIVAPLTLTLLAERVPGRAAAAPRWASGRASAASASRSGRSSAAPSSTASRGTGSSGSTSRIGARPAPARRARACARATARRRTPRPARRRPRRRPACSRSSSASSAVRATAGRAR